jgi:hypothetical protein
MASFQSMDRSLHQPPTSTTDQTKVKNSGACAAVMEPPCVRTRAHQMGWQWHMLLPHGQGQRPQQLAPSGLGMLCCVTRTGRRSPLMEEGRGHPTTTLTSFNATPPRAFGREPTSSRPQPRHFP